MNYEILEAETIDIELSDIELSADQLEWKEDKGKTRILFCAINESGHYSLPIRLLSLLVYKNLSLSLFDPKFIEWENEPGSISLEQWGRIILDWRPQILAVSVNIWNKSALLDLIYQVKAGHPDICVLAGGQEMTHSAVNYLEEHSCLDYIIDGDGEIPLQKFLAAWNFSKKSINSPGKIPGLWYRENEKSRFAGPGVSLATLDIIPSPILHGLVPVHGKDRLGVLLETTRGCPFRCSYCFEGSRKNMIQLESLDRLEQEIYYMASRGAILFHILDPILCNNKIGHLEKISKIIAKIKKQYPRILVAVEAYGERITENNIQYMDFCSIMDIGLQSIHPKTVKEIHRRFDKTLFLRGIELLHKTDILFNIYLICGLPHESLTDFFQGIHFVLDQSPPGIFINNLFLLNGTELRYRADEYGYDYDLDPPYRVKSNRWMDEPRMCLANKISAVVAGRHNLSFLKFKIHGLPWVKGLKSKSLGKLSVYVEGGCSMGCPQCFRTACSEPPSLEKQLENTLGQARNHDIEFVCGDKIDIDSLCMAASRFQLAGVVRIKLTAPMRLIEQIQDLQPLVNAGIWHYTLYVDTPGRGKDLGPVLNKWYRLNMPITIKPFIEVFTHLDDRSEEMIEAWGNDVKLLTFAPDNTKELSGKTWKPRFFKYLEQYNAFIKLPEGVLSSVLDDYPDKLSILRHMKELQMISDTNSSQPPCHCCGYNPL